MFALEGIPLDPQGKELEPEKGPDEFVEWLRGLMPQETNVPYSGQKELYLIAVYEAVPEWLGVTADQMKSDYGYSPEELSEAFRKQQGPKSAVIEGMLTKLISKAESIISEEHNNNYRTGNELF